MRQFESRYLYGFKSADMQKRTYRVRAVKKRAHVVSPVVRIAVGDIGPDRFAVMEIFAFAVLKFAERARFIKPLHLARGMHITIVFRVRINFPALLDRFEKGDRFRHILNGEYFTEYVFARVKALYRERRVFVRVVRKHDRVQIASKDLKDVEFFGIVPVPKYDSAQENYSTILGFPYSLYGISKGSRNEDDAAVTLECMASEGYRQVTPVVFEEGMKAKYAHDSTVAQMYDILRETLSFDIGRLFTMSFQKITFQKFREAVGDGAQDWSTMMKTQTKMLDRLVGKFNDNFSGMEG